MLAILMKRQRKEAISLRVNADVLAWFRSHGGRATDGEEDGPLRDGGRRRPGVYSRANAASKATWDGAKSVALIFAHASRAPNSRSIPPSSHSIDSGPA